MAYVHVLGRPAGGALQEGTLHVASPEVINPTDAAASAFYMSNSNNALVS